MGPALTVFLVGLGMAFVTALVVFVLVYPPMRRMLGVNSALRATRSLCGRTVFKVMLQAGGVPVVVSMGMARGGGEGAAEGAAEAVAPAADETPALMEIVWDVASDLDEVCLAVGVFLLVYVVVLTIVYAALGRIRDPEEQPRPRL